MSIIICLILSHIASFIAGALVFRKHQSKINATEAIAADAAAKLEKV